MGFERLVFHHLLAIKTDFTEIHLSGRISCRCLIDLELTGGLKGELESRVVSSAKPRIDLYGGREGSRGEFSKPGRDDEPGRDGELGRDDKPGRDDEPGRDGEPGRDDKPGRDDEPGRDNDEMSC